VVRIRERRLGSRRRRERWDYKELFSVTILLILWSALYRWSLLAFALSQHLGPTDGWLVAPQGPAPLFRLMAFVWIGFLTLNAGCLLEQRNRTRAGAALATLNFALLAALGLSLFSHTLLELELHAHHLSGARSPGNLARELVGVWEVVESEEPIGDRAFPGRVIDIGRTGSVSATRGTVRAAIPALSEHPVPALREAVSLRGAASGGRTLEAAGHLDPHGTSQEPPRESGARLCALGRRVA